MALLSADVRAQVRKILEPAQSPVAFEFYPRLGDPGSDMMANLLMEVADLSPQLDVVRHSESAVPIFPETASDLEGPVTLLTAGGQATGIRFLGLPEGHEFGPFLESVLAVSVGQPSTLSSDTRRYLSTLRNRLHMAVFVTPT